MKNFYQMRKPFPIYAPVITVMGIFRYDFDGRRGWREVQDLLC